MQSPLFSYSSASTAVPLAEVKQRQGRSGKGGGREGQVKKPVNVVTDKTPRAQIRGQWWRMKETLKNT